MKRARWNLKTHVSFQQRMRTFSTATQKLESIGYTEVK